MRPTSIRQPSSSVQTTRSDGCSPSRISAISGNVDRRPRGFEAGHHRIGATPLIVSDLCGQGDDTGDGSSFRRAEVAARGRAGGDQHRMEIDANRHQHEGHRQQQVVGGDARIDHAEPQHPADPQQVQGAFAARPVAAQPRDTRRRERRSPAAASAAWSGRCARTCRADNASPRRAIACTSSRDSGALLVARAIENARIIADNDSAITDTSHARFGATIHAITITTSGIMNWRSPGRSNRFKHLPQEESPHHRLAAARREVMQREKHGLADHQAGSQPQSSPSSQRRRSPRDVIQTERGDRGAA